MLAGLDESPEVRLAEVIIGASRDLAASLPPPRGAPFFYLDAMPAYGFDVLATLSRRGIFRKYELVLEVGSRLGARARWLAAHLGCRLVGVDASLSAVAAAQLLNSRAHMSDQVLFQVGLAAQLPFQPRCFTHVWMLDPERCAPTADNLGEAFRVLRPGGYLAIHGLHAQQNNWRDLSELLCHVGFVELTHCSVEVPELPHVYHLAAVRMRTSIEVQGIVADPGRLGKPGPCLQVFGRRPA